MLRDQGFGGKSAAFLALAGAVTLIVGQRRAVRSLGTEASRWPLVAPSALELRLPQLGLVLLTLVMGIGIAGYGAFSLLIATGKPLAFP